MNTELALLRALLRLARRRTSASLGEILLRIDADPNDAHRALASLARSGLVHRTAEGPRLTMAGFAIAVATAAAVPNRKPQPKRPAPARANVLTLGTRLGGRSPRRHRAA